ncbi:hypothetical protein FACS189493_0730 [Spirochaetia bacterium]|nr:hypothetical protein FACS189493_0730 [Spirochaetia bacterium]
MTNYEELSPVLSRLRSFDLIDQVCYANAQKTGRPFEPADGVKISELIAMEGFPGLLDDDASLRTALETGNFEAVSRIVFSEYAMFPKERDVVLSKSARYCTTNEHQHDYYEIECVLCGSAYHYVDKSMTIAAEGDTIIVPPHVPHNLQVIEDGTVVNIGIRQSTFHKVFRQLLEDSLPLSQYFQKTLYDDKYRNALIFHCGADTFWRDTILRLYDQHLEDRPYARQIINHLTQVGLYYIMQHYPPQQAIVPNKQVSNRMDRVYRFIDANHQNTSLREAAKHFNLTVPYLSSSIKGYYGIPFTALLRSVRLRHACELLRNTNMRVVDVCCNVGYSEESHFITLFRKEFGITPKQYQSKNGHGARR